MILMKFTIFILIFFHYQTCNGNVYQQFSEILSLGRIFNLSSVDSIFHDFKLGIESWNKNIIYKNSTKDCNESRIYSDKFFNYSVNIENQNDLNILNNYILAQLLKNPCEKLKSSAESRKSMFVEVWIYGLLTVTLNNVLAVLGIFFIPLIKKKIYNSVMTFMVSLAIGALAGTSILILIPDSMQISEIALKAKFEKNDYKWKATVVFLGLYLFFLTERLLKSITNQRETPKYSHNIMKFEIMKLTNEELLESLNQTENILMQHRKSLDENEEIGGKITENENNKKEIMENDKKNKAIAPVAWMIVFGDSLHNLVDGMSIGAGFSQSIMLGISISMAVLCEELPHELGDFAVLLTSGMSVKQAVFWNLMSAMTCYLGFIIGAIVGEISSASVWIFAIAGGMFLYISLVDMMNTLIETIDDMTGPWRLKAMTFILQNLGLFTGYTVILILSLYGDRIQFGY